MLKFERFGNAYAAEINGTLYVVSFYNGAWAPFYRTAEMAKPAPVGNQHGYHNAVDAMHACQDSRAIK
jgi:hypothetical protein